MKIIVILSFIFLFAKSLYSSDIAISAAVGTPFPVKSHGIGFSDGSYAYKSNRSNLTVQILRRNLFHGFYPALQMIYTPAHYVDSADVQRAPRLRYEMLAVSFGIGKSFDIGYTKLDLLISVGKNWQTFFGYHRDDVVTVPHNAMCFIFETHVRSRLFKHLYTDFGYGYLHQGDRNFTGSLNALHYELSTFNKIFLMTFGLQIIL